MKVSLVTGGAGFIGSHVVRHCLALGHKVVVLDDLSSGFQDHLPAGIHFVKGSINDLDLIRDMFRTFDFDFVYHLAAYAAEGFSHFIRRFNYQSNLMGSINLINAAVQHDVECFVFTSSLGVYGTQSAPLKERMQPHPEDPNAIAKYAVELDLAAAHELFGLNYVIFRPHNVYGEHQFLGDRYRNVIGIFMNQLLSGQPITVYGDGQQTRAFSYIDDVAIPIARSVHIPEAYNEIFNIGADQPYTIEYLIEMIAREFDIQPELQYLPQRYEVQDVWADHEKAHLFGRAPYVSLQDGIRRMATWAKKIGARRERRFDAIEIRQGVPQGWDPSVRVGR
ncbi:NAD-dependent epimerase/dehydratase family protein [Pontibacter sp. G13]|uniref:NAD-dependent epimerase/dehydratase family protein n=1 Tax=Pontibacter sp. G13 TaxID=3074898 RepID=UPI00288B39C5|nr:NAD-dependent epimerase/dehydratase family protein [Pontibacter sp. G13]WNJ21062.1 NAD-dependent epimerase/dehydratase family protein [Pontibacter sp. G13]